MLLRVQIGRATHTCMHKHHISSSHLLDAQHYSMQPPESTPPWTYILTWRCCLTCYPCHCAGCPPLTQSGQCNVRRGGGTCG